jgi:hypothetical protein
MFQKDGVHSWDSQCSELRVGAFEQQIRVSYKCEPNNQCVYRDVSWDPR